MPESEGRWIATCASSRGRGQTDHDRGGSRASPPDATASWQAAGWTQTEAELRAVTEFGRVEDVADEFRTTAVAVVRAQRTAWLLLAGVGAQPFIWAMRPGPERGEAG